MEQANRDGFAAIAAQVKEVHTCVDCVSSKLDQTMHGDAAKPGLVVRLDRLEQAHERTRWLTRAIVGAVVTLAVGALWTLLK